MANAKDLVTNLTLLNKINDLQSKAIDLREPSCRAITTAHGEPTVNRQPGFRRGTRRGAIRHQTDERT